MVKQSMEKEIFAAEPRKEVQVVFPDGTTFNGPKGATAEAFVIAAKPDTEGKTVKIIWLELESTEKTEFVIRRK